MKEWQHGIGQQLAATAGIAEVAGHRSLVDQRWALLCAFTQETTSPTKLSPLSKKLKENLFKKEGSLDEASLNQYKKKFTSMIQGLSNASDRLDAVHKEDVAEQDQPGDSTV